MGFSLFPHGEMFIDWCPLPARVFRVEPGRRWFKLAIPPERQASLFDPDMPPMAPMFETAEVELRELAYPHGNGLTEYRFYGWHGLTCTVVVSDPPLFDRLR